jgi:hypothetical protein
VPGGATKEPVEKSGTTLHGHLVDKLIHGSFARRYEWILFFSCLYRPKYSAQY